MISMMILYGLLVRSSKVTGGPSSDWQVSQSESQGGSKDGGPSSDWQVSQSESQGGRRPGGGPRGSGDPGGLLFNSFVNFMSLFFVQVSFNFLLTHCLAKVPMVIATNSIV